MFLPSIIILMQIKIINIIFIAKKNIFIKVYSKINIF
jgi:hypothetical protein